VQILDLLEHKAIFTAGYKAILHLHSLVEECEVTNLIAQIDKKTGEKKKVGRYAHFLPVSPCPNSCCWQAGYKLTGLLGH
jgi:translation elongation factor EF-1alpha